MLKLFLQLQSLPAEDAVDNSWQRTLKCYSVCQADAASEQHKCCCCGLTWPGQAALPMRAGLSAFAEPCLQVYAWGWGRYGNLGDGDRSDRQGHTDFCCMSKCAFVVLVQLARTLAQPAVCLLAR